MKESGYPFWRVFIKSFQRVFNIKQVYLTVFFMKFVTYQQAVKKMVKTLI